ncbi:hypothetical protein BK004_01125 [bacterium CG10_46_32]|nr:MAG: hypothetical protein BK004_01125 [bacterium CG10_46_32]PIR56380.1 MAG: hypothetical protein COU73_01140 [Parcubacteria group bacterium CG10_big_fil_rev_8_21_14_0_10_46_32]
MKYPRLFALVAFFATFVNAGNALAGIMDVPVSVSDTADTKTIMWDPSGSPQLDMPNVTGAIGDTIAVDIGVTQAPFQRGWIELNVVGEFENATVHGTLDFVSDGVFVNSDTMYTDWPLRRMRVDFTGAEGGSAKIGKLKIFVIQAGEYTINWTAHLESPGGGITNTVGVSVLTVYDPNTQPNIQIQDAKGLIGEEIWIPVEITNGSMQNGRLTLSMSGVSRLDFVTGGEGVSVEVGNSEGTREVRVDFAPDEQITGLLGYIIVASQNAGEYTCNWDMFFPYLGGGVIDEVTITITKPLVKMDIPNIAARVGEEIRIPVSITTSPYAPGAYSGGFAFEFSDGAIEPMGTGFEGVDGLIVSTRKDGGRIIVIFAAVPAIEGTIGYLTFKILAQGTHECEWEAVLKTDTAPGDDGHRVYSATMITGLPAFDVNVEPNPAVMGDEIIMTMTGGKAPFFIPSGPMQPSMLMRAEDTENPYVSSIVPNDLSVWPQGARSVDVTALVSDGDNQQSNITFTVQARIGDVNADNQITVMDVSFVLYYILETNIVPFTNYQKVTADADMDGRIWINDAVHVLHMVLGLPIPVSGDGGCCGKRLANYEITTDVLNNARKALADLAGDDSPGATQIRQMIYSIIGGKGVLTAVEETESLPTSFNLGQNYPNPFNPTTTITYTISEPGDVTLTVYNTVGQLIAELTNGFHAAGSYTANWNAGNVSSGTYFYVLEASGFRDVRRMSLLK